jgi:hypothetical protein
VVTARRRRRLVLLHRRRLSRSEYLHGVTAAGLVDATIEFTGAYAESMHAAIIQARRS